MASCKQLRHVRELTDADCHGPLSRNAAFTEGPGCLILPSCPPVNLRARPGFVTTITKDLRGRRDQAFTSSLEPLHPWLDVVPDDPGQVVAESSVGAPLERFARFGQRIQVCQRRADRNAAIVES